MPARLPLHWRDRSARSHLSPGPATPRFSHTHACHCLSHLHFTCCVFLWTFRFSHRDSFPCHYTYWAAHIPATCSTTTSPQCLHTPHPHCYCYHCLLPAIPAFPTPTHLLPGTCCGYFGTSVHLFPMHWFRSDHHTPAHVSFLPLCLLLLLPPPPGQTSHLPTPSTCATTTYPPKFYHHSHRSTYLLTELFYYHHHPQFPPPLPSSTTPCLLPYLYSHSFPLSLPVRSLPHSTSLPRWWCLILPTWRTPSLPRTGRDSYKDSLFYSLPFMDICFEHFLRFFGFCIVDFWTLFWTLVCVSFAFGFCRFWFAPLRFYGMDERFGVVRCLYTPAAFDSHTATTHRYTHTLPAHTAPSLLFLPCHAPLHTTHTCTHCSCHGPACHTSCHMHTHLPVAHTHTTCLPAHYLPPQCTHHLPCQLFYWTGSFYLPLLPHHTPPASLLPFWF